MPQYLMPGCASKAKGRAEERVLSPVVGTMLAQIVENRSKFYKAHTNEGIDTSELNRSLVNEMYPKASQNTKLLWLKEYHRAVINSK